MAAYIDTKQKTGTWSMESVLQQVAQSIAQFRYLTRRYALFHVIFFSFFICELIGLLLFFSFLAKSFLLATIVAATFLTAFSYFVLRFYFQTKKPEQFLHLRDTFIQTCEQLFSMSPDLYESRRGFLHAIYRLIQELEGQEFQYYQVPKSLEALAPLIQKFSVWCHWEDVHLMKEILHAYSLRTQLEWVKIHPTDLELHRGLASSYISFYKIYQDPATLEQPSYSFIAKEYASAEMMQKFQKAAHCAIEELKIVLHYTPQDTLALTQLAETYHALDQKEEERKTYEILLQFSPRENDIRLRLGVLYFQLGFVAQGLKFYDELRKLNDPKAEQLIQHYDLFHSLNI